MSNLQQAQMFLRKAQNTQAEANREIARAAMIQGAWPPYSAAASPWRAKGPFPPFDSPQLRYLARAACASNTALSPAAKAELARMSPLGRLHAAEAPVESSGDCWRLAIGLAIVATALYVAA